MRPAFVVLMLAVAALVVAAAGFVTVKTAQEGTRLLVLKEDIRLGLEVNGWCK